MWRLPENRVHEHVNVDEKTNALASMLTGERQATPPEHCTFMRPP